MSRKRPRRSKHVPRKTAVRRSAYREHQNKYAEYSNKKHNAYGVEQDQ
jgi:hypothetical protein